MSSIVIAAVLFLISSSSPPTETCTKEFRRAPSIIGISGEIAEGTVLERQVGRCGGLPRRRHASEVNGEERSRKRRIRRFREGKREKESAACDGGIPIYSHQHQVGPRIYVHVRARTYALARFCPGCFLMLLCPPRRSYRGSRVVSLELYVCVG